MALAQHISIQNTKTVNQHFLWKISQSSTVFLKRLLWHTKAYATILGIMVLTFVSVGFLYIHWSGKKLTQIFPHRTVVEQK